MPRAQLLQFLRDNLKFSGKKGRMLRALALFFALIASSAFAVVPLDTSSQLIISVKDQKLVLVQNGAKVATYPVSTSAFGLGDALGKMTTPLGYLAVEKKIGDNAPVGAVFHNRRLTGEVLQPNAPGRDPVTTRIIWLRGLESQNAHAFQRCIYIHGTPEEKKIGRPASYGCIRMKASDIAELYDRVPPGALVQITPDGIPKLAKAKVPRSETSNGVVAVAAATPTQSTVQNSEPPPKLAKAPRIVAAKSIVEASMLAAPPEHLMQTQPEGHALTQHHDKAGHRESAGNLTVEDMRMRGGLAAERRKTKLALGKRL